MSTEIDSSSSIPCVFVCIRALHRSGTRRQFLSAALVGLTAKGERRIAGGFVNDAFPTGHRIRDHATFSKPARVEKYPIVIVGGGIAGLSAAWRLAKRGFRDFVLLEMEAQPGGNSRWGENEITAYPWAAHYVPVPDARESLVRELFEELGVLKDGKWDERRLCFSPQERLFLHGRWQEGIEPEIASTARDREDYLRFHDLMAEHRASGAFTIPMERGERADTSTKGGARHPLTKSRCKEWMAAESFHVAVFGLVRELRVPRRLRCAGSRYFGVGGCPLLRFARSGG